MFEILIALNLLFILAYAIICFFCPKTSFRIWFWLTDQMEDWQTLLKELEADNEKRKQKND